LYLFSYARACVIFVVVVFVAFLGIFLVIFVMRIFGILYFKRVLTYTLYTYMCVLMNEYMVYYLFDFVYFQISNRASLARVVDVLIIETYLLSLFIVVLHLKCHYLHGVILQTYIILIKTSLFDLAILFKSCYGMIHSFLNVNVFTVYY
jgi:hypothetical protein